MLSKTQTPITKSSEVNAAVMAKAQFNEAQKAELRRLMYERIAQGNTLNEIENMAQSKLNER